MIQFHAQTNPEAEAPTPTQYSPERHIWKGMKQDLRTMLVYLHWPAFKPPPGYPQLKLVSALLHVLTYTIILGYGVAGGTAAAATFANMQHLPYSREILGNGAIGGLVITATFHVQVLVAVLISYVSGFQNGGRGGRCVLGRRVFRDSKIIGVNLLLLVLQFGLSFARTSLTALALISRFHFQSKIFILGLCLRIC
jgi:hypothetical protein